MAYSTRIIEIFGGTRALSRLLNVAPSTVQSWKDSGIIPAKHQQAVLDAARLAGKPVTPSDFFDADEPQMAPKAPGHEAAA